MNAKELHDLYAPLWDAVPATRPKNTRLGATGDIPRFVQLWYDRDWKATWEPIGDDCAAALCRVAAEDWLRTGTYWNKSGPCVATITLMIRDIDESETVEWLCVGDECSCEQGYRKDRCANGPTIHHALVAACLAVHNAAPSAAPPS